MAGAGRFNGAAVRRPRREAATYIGIGIFSALAVGALALLMRRRPPLVATPVAEEPAVEKKPRRRGFGMFVLGFVLGAVALFGLALYASLKNF